MPEASASAASMSAAATMTTMTSARAASPAAPAPVAVAITAIVAVVASTFVTASALFGGHRHVFAIKVRLVFGVKGGTAFDHRRWRTLRNRWFRLLSAFGFRRRSCAASA